MKNRTLGLIFAVILGVSSCSVDASTPRYYISQVMAALRNHSGSVFRACACLALVAGVYRNRPSQWRYVAPRRTIERRGSSTITTDNGAIIYPPFLEWFINSRFSVSSTTTASRVVEGSGVKKETTMQVSEDIDSICMQAPGTLKIYLAAGADAPSVRVEGDDNAERYITISEHGRDLIITLEEDVAISPKLPLELHVALRALKKVKMSAASRLEAPASFNVSNDFELELSGASEAALAFHANNLKATVTGASQASLSGLILGKQTVRVSGASQYTAPELQSTDAQVTVLAASSARIQADSISSITAVAASSVEYRSKNPARSVNTSDSSSVHRY